MKKWHEIPQQILSWAKWTWNICYGMKQGDSISPMSGIYIRFRFIASNMYMLRNAHGLSCSRWKMQKFLSCLSIWKLKTLLSYCDISFTAKKEASSLNDRRHWSKVSWERFIKSTDFYKSHCMSFCMTLSFATMISNTLLTKALHQGNHALWQI